MQKIGIAILAILFLLIGCDETSKTIVSVKNDFKTTGTGKLVATVENAGDQINLKGTLDLTEGGFDIFLTNPSGDTIYSESFKKKGEYTIDKKFDRLIGNWVFIYSISILNDIAPSGSFDFDIVYND